MLKRSLKIAGLAMLGSTYHHLHKPNTYIAAGAIGLGAGLAHKSVEKGITTGLLAAWGMIGYTGLDMIDSAEKAVRNGED